MTPLVWIAMPGNEPMAERLSALTGGEIAALETRRFPDGETYLRLTGGVSRRQVAIVCTLDHPDGKFLPLAFAAATARELGASRVGLVAPYLAYMRQDRRFKDGEAVTATQFARLLSGSVDWLVKRIAAHVRCPFVVLAKRRLGDRQVAIDLPDLSAMRGRKPVPVDDIISSAGTMMEAARRVAAAGLPRPVCAAVHGLFAGDSFERLSMVAEAVVTTNTVAHRSNAIDLSDRIAPAVAEVTLL